MIKTAPEGMTKELWLKRCSARFAERVTDMTPQQCDEIAEICFESVDSDLMEHPEDAADEELSNWCD